MTGRSTAVPVLASSLVRIVRPLLSGRPPANRTVVGKPQGGRVPELRATWRLKPHWTPRLFAEFRLVRNHPAFDFDLRLARSSRAMRSAAAVSRSGSVEHYYRVGALVESRVAVLHRISTTSESSRIAPLRVVQGEQTRRDAPGCLGVGAHSNT